MTDWMHNNRIFGYIAPSFKTMQMGQARTEEWETENITAVSRGTRDVTKVILLIITQITVETVQYMHQILL